MKQQVDGLALYCNVTLLARDPKTGRIRARRKAHNLITTLGRVLIARFLAEEAGRDTGITYLAIGTGPNAPTMADTTLQTETARKGVSTPVYRTSDRLQFKGYFPSVDCNVFVKEVGLFGHSTASAAANSGDLFNHALLSYDNSGGSPVDLTFYIGIVVGEYMAFDNTKTYSGPVATDDALAVNLLNGAFFQYGTAGAKPAFGNRGIIYWETDTALLWYDTGSAWVQLPFLNALAQSITGIKTFGSIPVLPASDPTTDHQATRKLYVDTKAQGTDGNYVGDDSNNRAIAHGLGIIPRSVHISNTSGYLFHIIKGVALISAVIPTAVSQTLAVTAMDATNFHVGNATSYANSANTSGVTYYWVAQK